MDSTTAARLIEALALGLIMQGVIDPHGAAWDEVTRDSFQMLMKGLSL